MEKKCFRTGGGNVVKRIVCMILLLLLLAACTMEKVAVPVPAEPAGTETAETTVVTIAGTTAAEEEKPEMGYKQITQEEAKRMMARDDGHLIVDVRRPD